MVRRCVKRFQSVLFLSEYRGIGIPLDETRIKPRRLPHVDSKLSSTRNCPLRAVHTTIIPGLVRNGEGVPPILGWITPPHRHASPSVTQQLLVRTLQTLKPRVHTRSGSTHVP